MLIVGLCTAVYILLRDHSPTNEERAVRRQLSQRRREQQSDLSSPFTYASSSLTPVTLTNKIGGMLGMSATAHADENNGKKTKDGGSKGGRGWIRAGSGDDWETRADSRNEMQNRFLSGPQPQMDAESGQGICPQA